MNFLIDHYKDFHVLLQLQVSSTEQIVTLGITYPMKLLICRDWQCFQHYEIFLWLPRVIPSSRLCRTSYIRRAEIVWESITAHVGIISGYGEQEARHFQGAGTRVALPFQIHTHTVRGRSCCHRTAQKDKWATWMWPLEVAQKFGWWWAVRGLEHHFHCVQTLTSRRISSYILNISVKFEFSQLEWLHFGAGFIGAPPSVCLVQGQHSTLGSVGLSALYSICAPVVPSTEMVFASKQPLLKREINLHLLFTCFSFACLFYLLFLFLSV